MKKILSVFSAVIMLLSITPLEGFVGIELFSTKASALAEGGFSYTVINDEATIMKSLIEEIIIYDDRIELQCKCGVTVEQEYVKIAKKK